ncbi:unnamed protein product [Darwinula stevensoni]|uniref:Wiskott-Aldrich syndrome protein n=1 Tax=Darwinula stevensoni TaxID=69355 RepID=A0A7R8X364_9CRUS|nr:unnamed protein product [Darwinula stevensoni]CAG0882204.1 unnamed protein product [Darwinula stevensoni]
MMNSHRSHDGKTNASGQRKQRPVENKASRMLCNEENAEVFRAIGNRCKTLSTAVVQLFLSKESDDHKQWHKFRCGIITFVKDNGRRAYFLRLFDPVNYNMAWEQELYQQFSYKMMNNHFHMFEAHDCMAGLNFANQEEAYEFGVCIREHVQKRSQRKQQKRQMMNKGPPKPVVAQNGGLNSGPSPSMPSNGNKGNKKSRKKSKTGKRVITKDDIGLPSNFQHVSHVGWDPNRGFDLDNVDPQLKEFFYKAGVSETHLKDQETRRFIYDFIETHGGLEAAMQEVQDVGIGRPPLPPQQPPPPVPSRHNQTMMDSAARRPTVAPPPTPPSRQKPPPPPPTRGVPQKTSTPIFTTLAETSTKSGKDPVIMASCAAAASPPPVPPHALKEPLSNNPCDRPSISPPVDATLLRLSSALSQLCSTGSIPAPTSLEPESPPSEYGTPEWRASPTEEHARIPPVPPPRRTAPPPPLPHSIRHPSVPPPPPPPLPPLPPVQEPTLKEGMSQSLYLSCTSYPSLVHLHEAWGTSPHVPTPSPSAVSAPTPPPMPPPASAGGNKGAAPPPPPPMPSGVPPPPRMPLPPSPSSNDPSPSLPAKSDNHGALMEAIRSGATLKRVDVNEEREKRSSDSNSRGALLQQIRQGVELKSVGEPRVKSENGSEEGGLAGALKKALQDRSHAFHSSDSSTSDSSESEEDEWED